MNKKIIMTNEIASKGLRMSLGKRGKSMDFFFTEEFFKYNKNPEALIAEKIIEFWKSKPSRKRSFKFKLKADTQNK